MRHQQRIYIQNAHTCIRNKDIVNVSMSSDICEFQEPTFGMFGADKIKTGSTVNDDEIHIVSTGTTIDLTFSFTGNVESFINTETTFSYNIYKYNNNSSQFTNPPIFQSQEIEYQSFSATSAFTNSILVTDLNIDGQYLVKGSFNFITCTTILGELGDTNTTFRLIGDQYGLYENDFDYYFAAIRQAAKPRFSLSPTDVTTLGTLRVESYEVSGGTQVSTTNTWLGNPIVSLNGVTFFEDVAGDFTTANNQNITFNGPLIDGDIVTIAYVNAGNPNGLVSEPIIVPNPIVSGITDGEGSEKVYYNTDTGKYELFILTDPVEFNDVIVTLEGVTLANGTDYIQSTTNPRRIITNGLILSNDIITITYNSAGTYVGNITVDNFELLWTISPAPSNNYGLFTALVADDDSFSGGTIIFSATTPYVTNSATYQVHIDLSGYSGATAYYKVINEKYFDVLSGDTIVTINESDIIPIEIQL